MTHPYTERNAKQLEQYRALLDDIAGVIKGASRGSIDEDALEDLQGIGDRAGELWAEINNQDNCGCSDPHCPCDGPKR